MLTITVIISVITGWTMYLSQGAWPPLAALLRKTTQYLISFRSINRYGQLNMVVAEVQTAVKEGSDPDPDPVADAGVGMGVAGR